MAESSARPLPVYRAPHNIVWFLGPDGRFLQASGSGLRRNLVGRHIEELYATRPEMLAMFRATLAGAAWSDIVEYDGSLWHVEAEPAYRDGDLVGVSGMCVAVADARGEDDANTQEMQVVGNHPDHGMGDGDEIIVRRGKGWFTQIRFRPIRELHMFALGEPGGLRHLNPCPSSPSPRRHLHAVP